MLRLKRINKVASVGFRIFQQADYCGKGIVDHRCRNKLLLIVVSNRAAISREIAMNISLVICMNNFYWL